MKKYLFSSLIALLMVSCNSGGSSSQPEAVNTQGFIMEQIPGSDWVRAVKVNAAGSILEEGFLNNGIKEGTWVTYIAGNEFPQKIESFINGINNGNYMEFNERGQLTLRAGYRNNKLHGPWGLYRFGRPEKTANYKNGELDGVYKEYFNRDGKIQKEIHYRNGIQHGPYRFFNEEGEITLEYEYKDGEEVGGGIVNPDKVNDPK